MTKKDITHLNTILEYLNEVGELLTSDAEVDPHLELAGIQKALDNGPALLFNTIKGYPNARFAANIFSRDDRIAKIFDVQDMRDMSFLPDRKDYSSFQIAPGSHMWQIATRYYKKEPIPLTMCMGLPPACYLVAGSGFNYLSLPEGADEIGLAGTIQGSPIELVKARTVDAYAIANSQFVLEGYLDTTQRVWDPLARMED